MKTTISRLIIFSLLLYAIPVFASSDEVVEKVIYLKGDESYLMKGDPLLSSKYKGVNFKRKQVLPYLLSRGWKIKSIHVSEKSKENDMYGYIVVESKILRDEF